MNLAKNKILFASNNLNKLKEVQNILDDFCIQIISQSELFIPEVEETGSTFVENAMLKALNAAKYTNLPIIADDSGLEIDALHGVPGVHSARYAGPKCTYQDNIVKVLNDLINVPIAQRAARFRCVITYIIGSEQPIIFEASWEGSILLKPQGISGFGYDPIFWVPTHNCSAAELPVNIKNQISHRALALKKLKDYLRESLT